MVDEVAHAVLLAARRFGVNVRQDSSAETGSRYIKLRGDGAKCLVRIADHRSAAFKAIDDTVTFDLRVQECRHFQGLIRWMETHQRERSERETMDELIKDEARKAVLRTMTKANVEGAESLTHKEQRVAGWAVRLLVDTPSSSPSPDEQTPSSPSDLEDDEVSPAGRRRTGAAAQRLSGDVPTAIGRAAGDVDDPLAESPAGSPRD